MAPEVERELLEPIFPGWREPVERRLPGWRDDSLVAVAYGDEVVGVCYVTGDNQLGEPGYGELHYAAVSDEHKGKGLWAAMITELYARAAAWGVDGVIYVTDRAGPIQMYLRTGAVRIGTRPKEAPKPPTLRRRLRWKLSAARRAVRPPRRPGPPR